MSRLFSLRARIAFFGTGLVLVAVVVFAALLLWLVQATQPSNTQKLLHARGATVAAWVAGAGAEQLVAHPYPAPADLSAGTEVFAEVLGADGSLLFSTALDRGVAPSPPGAYLHVAPGHDIYGSTGSYSFDVRRWSRPDLGRDGYIVTGQSRQAAIDALAGVRGFLIISGIFTVAGGLLASWFVAGRALRPELDPERPARRAGLDRIGHDDQSRARSRLLVWCGGRRPCRADSNDAIVLEHGAVRYLLRAGSRAECVRIECGIERSDGAGAVGGARYSLPAWLLTTFLRDEMRSASGTLRSTESFARSFVVRRVIRFIDSDRGVFGFLVSARITP